jgi:hypothetical protein
MGHAHLGFLIRLNIMSRRSLFVLALLSGLAGALNAANAAAPAPVMSVMLDQAKIARIPEGTTTLVIGNPIVADVTMLKGSASMVVTGKGFGETNLIALDVQGNVLDEKTIRVVPSGSVLVVQRGAERESYSCAPQCMPTVQLGDGRMFGDASGQISARNGLVSAPTASQSQL